MKKPQATQQPSVQELRTFLDECGDPFNAGCGQWIIDDLRAEYGRVYAQYRALQIAQQEGIFEVTLRSATQVLTVQIASPREEGFQAGEVLEAQLMERMLHLSKSILLQIEDLELTKSKQQGLTEDPRMSMVHALSMPQKAELLSMDSAERCPLLPDLAAAD
ncbi:hypothetical protein [Hymenobacter sp. GOD-10R]|uniref:hypothetical protein n=1 Tax=Hymenobacter sp. GOD-10R TaxID=3093922 RepID=UPI002D79C479|nr:hypothetical protein [Hymenobacter sp. GOD-10R]WRQ27075.1 hypothetical protein SD425_18540 [Hymenobacter sp. GOD-10R]